MLFFGIAPFVKISSQFFNFGSHGQYSFVSKKTRIIFLMSEASIASSSILFIVGNVTRLLNLLGIISTSCQPKYDFKADVWP